MVPLQQPVVALPAAPTPAFTAPPAASAPLQPALTAPETAPEDNAKFLTIKSPMVGTFYRSPNPEKGPFVKIGDSVDAGTTVCIIEAMKLFNEIESDVKGKIVKVLVEDASPVEYDQPLFLVEPA
jgi:acetyl-CoA carboxylase biotin carboxyl carrier protein